MKKSVTIFILVAIVITFGIAMYYLYQKNAEDPIVYKTEKASTRTIVKKTMATGSIIPLEEVLIKPNISGVIDEVYVEGGDQVKANDLIAKIKVIPNLSSLNNAKNDIESAKISFDNEERTYKRQKELYDKGVISEQDFQDAEVAFSQARQRLSAARENYDIVKTGSTKGAGATANTMIRSTVAGMVLEVPVEVGNQVIEANNFNEGTTIAALADVNHMIFEGKIDESEIGKIKRGLPLEITVGAYENAVFEAVLDYIAPKGVLENGAVQFEIKGTLKTQDSTFIRAGLSANASIILDKAEDVMALKEGLVQYDPKTKLPFVEIKTGEKEFRRQDISLGLSDGIYVQVLEGVGKDDEIKVWN